MQEEVEQRIVSLMISCGKLGEQEFRKAVAKLLEQLKNGHQKHQYSKANPHGKMTVKQLAAKDRRIRHHRRRTAVRRGRQQRHQDRASRKADT